MTFPSQVTPAFGASLVDPGVRTLLPGGLLDLVGEADADEPVVGLELLHGLLGVVDEGKAGALATTVLGAEAEDGDLVLLGLVELGKLLAELILGDVGAVGVEDVPAVVRLPWTIVAMDALTQPSACGQGEGCG